MNFKIQLNLRIESYDMDDKNISSELREFNINKVLYVDQLSKLSLDELKFISDSDKIFLDDDEYIVLDRVIKINGDGVVYDIILSKEEWVYDYDYEY